MAQALAAGGKKIYDEDGALIWQAAQVSTVSVMNFSGRIIIGKNRLFLYRNMLIWQQVYFQIW